MGGQGEEEPQEKAYLSLMRHVGQMRRGRREESLLSTKEDAKAPGGRSCQRRACTTSKTPPRAQQGAQAGTVTKECAPWFLVFTFHKFHYRKFQV